MCNIILSKVYWLPSGIKGAFWWLKVESPYNVGDLGSILGSGRSSGEGNGNPLQDFCLENPMDRRRSLKGYSPLGRRVWNENVTHITKTLLQVALVVKNTPANTGDTGSIPESGKSSGEGNGNPLQYPCLGNPMNRGAWQASVHEFTTESEHNLQPKQQY